MYIYIYIYIYIYTHTRTKVSQVLLALATCGETKRQQHVLVLCYLSKPLVIYTRYSYMTLDFHCSTCNKSVSSINSTECNLCLTHTHFECNNLNLVGGQVIKNANK